MLCPDKIENWAANDDIKYGWFSSLSYIDVPVASNYYVNVFKRILQLPIAFRYAKSWCDCHTCLPVKAKKKGRLQEQIEPFIKNCEKWFGPSFASEHIDS
jgi:hypothetical protein